MLLISHSLVGLVHLCPMPQLLAYIDPSTGSLVFQAIAASIISAGLFIGAVRDRIIWLVTAAWRKKNSDDEAFIGNAHPADGDQPSESSRRAA
jgi:hypothetical protein